MVRCLPSLWGSVTRTNDVDVWKKSPGRVSHQLILSDFDGLEARQ